MVLTMRLPAHRRLARACAVLLLAWTAADLTGVASCALDGVGVSQTCASRPSLVEGALSADTAAPHIDDCFCCSRCVEASAGGFSATLSPLEIVASTPHSHQILIALLLYHPPQARA